MRRFHVTALTPLKRAPRVREFIALDTEDDQLGFGDGRGFYLGAVHTPAGSNTFRSRHALIRFLCQARWAGWWCATYNLEYDALNLWGVQQVVTMNPCFSGSRLCSLTIQVGDTPKDCLTIFDVGCFLSGGLRELAGLVNLEKLGMTFKAGDRRVTRRRIAYCARDAEITWKLANYVQDGVAELGAEMKLTAAATSLDCFRRRYLHEPLPCLPPEVQTWLHGGYCGGRVECFRLGDYREPLFKNDINGAYVSVMINQEFPDLGTFRDRGRELDLTQEGMADCQLEVPEHLWAAPLPMKGEKLTFPVGRLTGRWTYNELRQALNVGCKINRVSRSYSSQRTGAYLREMMLKLRAIREAPETPPAVSRMAKLLGNSLYGKFAQRNEEFKYITLAEYSRDVRIGKLLAWRDYDPDRTQAFDACRVVKLVIGNRIPTHSNVIWSACITAGCRMILYPHLDESSTFYCDTDSVLGRKEYPKTKTLGQLACQGAYSRLVIRGNKLYAGREENAWEAHAKGVPLNRALQAVRQPGVVLQSRRPVKLRTALRGGGDANLWIDVTKKLSAEYDKRRVLRGGETAPLKARMW
jgi:hypothetical protein